PLRARTEIAGLQRVVADLRQTKEVGLGKKYEPSNLVVPYLEGLAQKQQLEIEVKGGSDSTTGPEGFVQRSYRATVSDKDPARLLGWIDEALRGHPLVGEGAIEAVPGLEVGSIKLTPGFTDQEEDKVKWNLEITFKR